MKKERNGLLTILLIGLLTKAFGAPGYQNLIDPVDCTNEVSAISFPNPTDCNKYYQCENGTKAEMTCPLGQHYNVLLKTCDDPKYAGCKIQPSLNASVPVVGNTTENSTLTTQKSYSVLGLQNNTNSERNPAEKEGYETVTAVGVNNTSIEIPNNIYNATRSPEVINNTLSTSNSIINRSESSQATAAIDKKIKAEIIAGNGTSSSSNSTITSNIKSKSSEHGQNKISAEIATTNLSEESIESTTIDSNTLGKMNVTNDRDLKVVDEKYGNVENKETEDKDDETDEGDE